MLRVTGDTFICPGESRGRAATAARQKTSFCHIRASDAKFAVEGWTEKVLYSTKRWEGVLHQIAG
jgi:hypothetical protein